jgi:hypothetical protein
MNPQNNITHLQARTLLQSSLDGSLTDVQLQDLDEHLATCSDCREYAMQIQSFDQHIMRSLQSHWAGAQFTESDIESRLSMLLPEMRKNQEKIRSANAFRSLGWVALVALLIVSLVWTIKTLAPIPNQVPAEVISPETTSYSLLPTESPLPTVQVSSQNLVPTPIPGILPSNSASVFPNVTFSFNSDFPTSPESLTVFQQQLSEAVTPDSARQVASQWGINGEIYAIPSEGMDDRIFEAMDGSHTMRFLNFPDQYIYEVGYVSPDYGSALMDNGPLPSFDEQVRIATNFLEPFGILDLPYRTMPLETERGVVAFVPLLEGNPVVQEIGVDRSNIGWVDVKVNSPGQVTLVEYSRHEYIPIGEYPILSAQQAWDRFSNDVDLQHTRYAVLSPERPNSYQSWVQSYQPGEKVDLYGWVNTYQPVDQTMPPLVMMNNLPVIGASSAMIPSSPYDVRFIHTWGEIQDNTMGGIELNLTGWEDSSLMEEYITGTLQTQDGSLQLVTPDRVLTLINPPADISVGFQVGVQGVILEGDPATFDWKFIETGEIPFSYGASNSCGGGGGGGGGSTPDANFGGGRFAFLNFDTGPAPVATQVIVPYQPGDEIQAVTGIASITKHLYLGDKSSIEVNFYPDPPDSLAPGWGYALNGENLAGIEQYQNLPVRIWGFVDHLDKGIVFIKIDHYEPVYPGIQIQAWSGTEQIVSLEGQDVVIFTTTTGESYVVNSSLDWGAEGNVIGNLGDLIELEGYVKPDQQFGGYSILKDLAGSYPGDDVVDSAQISIWDHTQDPGSNPGAVLQGNVTIDRIELAYDAINLDRCQASAAQDPNMAPWLYVQPMWIFNGHFDDGRRLIVQVQALPDEYLK